MSRGERTPPSSSSQTGSRPWAPNTAASAARSSTSLRENLAAALGPDAPHHAALGHRLAEHAELGGAGDVADVDDLHAEAQVGLVAAVARHGVGVGEARERQRQLDAERLLEGGGEHALHHVLDVRFLDEAHLDVDLGVLRLAVGAQVLVAEGAGDLVVALEAGDHEQLLEQLGRLRQGVELARLQPAGHEEVAGALRACSW